MDDGFAVQNAKNGRSCHVAYDRRTDELQLMPMLRTCLMMTCARVQALVRRERVKVRSGFRRTKLARRGDVVRLLRRLQRDESIQGASAAHARQLAQFLKGRPGKGARLVVGGGTAKPTRKRPRDPESTADVILQDRLWDAKVGRHTLFYPCEGEGCSATINPLCLHASQDRELLLCRDCSREQKCLRSTRRPKGRVMVWLSRFGAAPSGPCSAGCGERLHFVRPWQQGHVEAASKGGEVMLPICGQCNLRQGTEHMAPFAAREHQTKIPSDEDSEERRRYAEMLYDCMIRGHDPRPTLVVYKQ